MSSDLFIFAGCSIWRKLLSLFLPAGSYYEIKILQINLFCCTFFFAVALKCWCFICAFIYCMSFLSFFGSYIEYFAFGLSSWLCMETFNDAVHLTGSNCFVFFIWTHGTKATALQKLTGIVVSQMKQYSSGCGLKEKHEYANIQQWHCVLSDLALRIIFWLSVLA